MNKAQINKLVTAEIRKGVPPLDAVLDVIVRAVAAGERVAVTGFGTFEKVDRPARFARNPQNGDRVQVPATAAPRFRPGQGFKDLVSGAKELPASGSAAAKAPKGSLTSGKSSVAAEAGAS